MDNVKIFSNRFVKIMYICTAVAIFTVAIVTVLVPKKGCSIDINEDYTNLHPLLLQADPLEFILPNDDSRIIIGRGETVLLACPGQNNYFPMNKLPLIQATCITDKMFSIGNSSHAFAVLKCKNSTQSTVRRSPNKCNGKYTQIEIGFDTTAGFLNLITSCFNHYKKDSLYSVHNLSSKTGFTQKTINPYFKQDKYYEDIDVYKLYQYTSQRQVFKRILKKSVESNINKDDYFNRGHLAPKGDFIFASQKLASFYYMNAAPQWKNVNDGNWEKLESSSRNFARSRNLNLRVYTGIYGQFQLRNNNEQLTDISLYVDRNNNHLLTVPQMYWKILYDPSTESATVFISHNNPYDYFKICNDVCDNIKWLTWQPNDIKSGISYCCEYAEVKKIISYLPDICVKKLLT